MLDLTQFPVHVRLTVMALLWSMPWPGFSDLTRVTGSPMAASVVT